MDRFHGGNSCGCYSGSIPASNITESDKDYRIEVALPGVDKENINIKHENGFLTVQVERSGNEKGEVFTRQEFDYSGTSRSYRIGDKIDTENIAARYENGLLILHLPKKEAYVSKPVKSIAIE
jgi:HSP20 family protein